MQALSTYATRDGEGGPRDGGGVVYGGGGVAVTAARCLPVKQSLDEGWGAVQAQKRGSRTARARPVTRAIALNPGGCGTHIVSRRPPHGERIARARSVLLPSHSLRPRSCPLPSRAIDNMACANIASNLSKHGSPKPLGRFRMTQMTEPPIESCFSLARIIL